MRRMDVRDLASALLGVLVLPESAPPNEADARHTYLLAVAVFEDHRLSDREVERLLG